MTDEQRQAVLENAAMHVRHIRRRPHGFGGYAEMYTLRRSRQSPDPHGGITKVTLTFEDGSVFEAEAQCSNLDNYNKKVGREIALGRAVKAAVAAGKA